MKIQFGRFRRLAYGALAVAVSAAVAIPALSGGSVSAAQATERKVTMTNATPGATPTTYTVSFKPPSGTATVGGIVVDFCADSPIIGSTTCTLPTNFTLGTTANFANITGIGVGGTWTAANSLQGAAAASNKQVFVLTNATAQAPTGSTTAITFDITGVTNPSSTGTFYARIYTFDTATNTTTNYTASGTTRVASPTGVRDSGGVALSTDSAISISATVQEQLTFCVSKAAPGSACSGTTTPTLTLGSGSPVILGTTAASDTAYHQITTNASGGISVALKNTSSAACSGLSRDAGATCNIAGRQTEGAVSNGSGTIGLLVANGSGGTGTVTADTDYDTNPNLPNATFGTYGDPISSTTGAVTDVNSLLTYTAAAAATTPAGVYTATHSLIATGQF